MDEEASDIICGNTQCKVSSTGVCVEGHQPLEACPHYGQHVDAQSIEEVSETIESVSENKAKSSATLFSGEALTTIQVDEFLRLRPAKFVAIIGDRNSGKTTLIDSIYGRFFRGPFAGYSFSGSRTLIAFERDCFFSRLASGKFEPDTAHTSISEGLRFYHISLTSQSTPQSKCDLMISDRAGELYSLARAKTDEISELIEIPNADRVVLLLDGERLASAAERAGAIQGVRQMVRALVDNNAMNIDSDLQIVTTKLDLLIDHPDKNFIDKQINSFRSNIQRDFKDRLANISFVEIAARDPEGKIEAAHGLSALFQDWASCPLKVPPRAKYEGVLSSEFDKLLSRTIRGALP